MIETWDAIHEAQAEVRSDALILIVNKNSRGGDGEVVENPMIVICNQVVGCEHVHECCHAHPHAYQNPNCDQGGCYYNSDPSCVCVPVDKFDEVTT